MPIKIAFEPSAATTDDEFGFAAGWLPGQLSAAGRAQAVELGRRRREDGIAAVFVSDLDRAVQTADLAFFGTGIPVHQDQRLRECNFGELNGAPVAVVDAERARRITEPFPGGQSYTDVVAAMAEFLSDLSMGFAGERVLFIAHAANRWALQRLLLGEDLAAVVGAPSSVGEFVY